MTVTVLVVEHDALTRETITCMLGTMKYATVGVESAEQAFRVLESVMIDVAVVGLKLGDPDGADLAGKLKARQQGIKAVVVSGRHAPERSGPLVDAFLQKPFSLQAIDEAITRVMGWGSYRIAA